MFSSQYLRRKFSLSARVLLMAILLLSVEAQATEFHSMTLIYSGNLDGELEPCGCTAEGDLGGIKRRVTMIDRLREKTPNLFLISGGGLITAFAANEKLMAEYILKGFASVTYDAVAVQWADLAYSREFILPYELPWVASNWQGDGFVHSRRIIKGQRQLRFFSWLDPTQSPQSQMQGGENPVTDAVATVLGDLEQAKREGATTVLATTLALGEVKQLFALKNIDILLVKAGYEEYSEPLREENTIVLEPGSRGMRLGRLDLQVDRGGGISSFTHTVIPLPSDVGDSPRMTEWYTEYNAKVKVAYLKSIEVKKALDTGQRPYAGEQACEACHAAIYSIWKKSRHADAYDALMLVNKAFDPACITCHTVGFNKEGGFIDATLTDHLKNVQCESCHGSAREHVVSKGKTLPANGTWAKKQICGQCHVPKHSPSFSLETYWPKIAH